MLKEIEAKLTKLNENKAVVVKNLQDLEVQTKKNMSDLQAISGAIQVCEQLKVEAQTPVEVVEEGSDDEPKY
jgi:hypothetical protein